MKQVEVSARGELRQKDSSKSESECGTAMVYGLEMMALAKRQEVELKILRSKLGVTRTKDDEYGG